MTFPAQVPMDEVGTKNKELLDAGIQACYGGTDGILRTFTVPMNVRVRWAVEGHENPYAKRVESELVQLNPRDFDPPHAFCPPNHSHSLIWRLKNILKEWLGI